MAGGLEAAAVLGLIIGAVYGLQRGRSFLDILKYSVAGAAAFSVAYLFIVVVAPIIVGLALLLILVLLLYIILKPLVGGRGV